MRVTLKRNRTNANAYGEYNPQTKHLIVLEGSTVSTTIRYSERFRGAKSIEKARSEWVRDGKVITNVEFKSPSTAANFITGNSTNGLTAWLDENGKSIKDLNAETNARKEARHE